MCTKTRTDSLSRAARSMLPPRARKLHTLGGAPEKSQEAQNGLEHRQNKRFSAPCRGVGTARVVWCAQWNIEIITSS